MPRGRNGSTTAKCRACCGTNGSSGAHMQHQISRWNLDHSDELHAAWMNGSGMMVWENVFGSWVPWSKRDRSILRAMLPIQRRFTALFQGEGWTPLVPAEQPGVYASLWEGGGLRLWTLVNRKAERVSRSAPESRVATQRRCFDLVAGREAASQSAGETAMLSGTIAPRGIGCFLSVAEQGLGRRFQAVSRTAAAVERPGQFRRLLRRAAKRGFFRRPRAAPAARVPQGMVEIPAATFEMTHRDAPTGVRFL